MLNIIRKIIHSLRLVSFHAQRDEFYEQMAKSYESRELFRDFLAAELKIARDPKTGDASRAYALGLMQRRLSVAEDSDVDTVVGVAVPEADRMMLTAVRYAQDKPAVLRALAEAIRVQKSMRAVMNKAVLPPLLILPGIFVYAYVMASESIPILVQMAPPEVWTPFNMFVRRFAEFIGGHTATLIVLAVAGVALVRYQLPRWTGRLRMQLEQVSPRVASLLFPVCPVLVPLSIYRDAQAGLMLSSLAVFLQSGRTLNDALDAIRQNSTPWMRWHVRRIQNHLQAAPAEYVKAFSKGLLSAQLLSRLASMIRTNPRFDQVLIKVGTVGTAEIQKEVGSQASRINLMVIVAGAAIVLLLIGGQMSISNSMQEELSPQKMQMRSRVK
jgi:type II secretory pathway component PulF